ncbi:MAG: hypothetical protein JWL72_433 [Ilumatobacteraceae bacterium]|nr:hypothetical protein [Ilumatobacteraceae bacterium]
MRFSRVLLVGALATGMVPLSAARSANAGGELIALSPVLSIPAALDTSGDFATDVLGDPWDFSSTSDIVPALDAGVTNTVAINVGGGLFTANTHNNAELRLLMNWSMAGPVLPWGHDGWRHPIDSSVYSVLDMSIRAEQDLNMAVRWWNAAGSTGVIPFTLTGGGFQTIHMDMNDRSIYKLPAAAGVWSGPITRFEVFRGLASAGGDPAVNIQLDWVRLHRPDAPAAPPANVPIPQLLTPNETGGADYATTVRGNPWDFAGGDDIAEANGVGSLDASSGDLTGTTTDNDPYIAVPVDGGLNTDKYHRFTADVCYGGGFGLSGAPGGGMVGRVVWKKAGLVPWISSQDFIVYPGPQCNSITLDLATTPPSALTDEAEENTSGWRGISLSALRFDLDEDPGARAFTLKNIKLADDAAFSSSYDITFADAAGSRSPTADIYATTTQGDFNGTQIASGIKVQDGINTFHWTGVDVNGTPMPNATYWIYVVMRNPSGVGTAVSTGPVRIERAVPPTPSYYVPLTPSRLLDTRDGEGGNISPLGGGVTTELRVAGVGGVPAAGATAVVMNLTAVDPTAGGFLTAWPSGETKPLVSNVNFIPGQTVPNLTTVKMGANGRVNIFNNAGDTHVIADVVGYYTATPPPSGGRFTAVTPSRILDTRSGVGGTSGPLGQDQSLNLTVTGVGGVPSAGVDAVALNVTVDQPTGQGFVTVWPTGVARPLASTHNFVPGLTVANMVIAKVGAGGQISVYNSSGNTHIVADVTGYFSSTGGLFVPVTPQRVVDTRDGTGGVPTLGFQDSKDMTVANGSPVPTSAKAVVVNVTSTDTATTGFLTVWPTGTPQPVASTLNPRPLVAVPNLAYLKVGTDGKLSVFNSTGSTNVVVDVFGYVTAP